MKFVPLCPPVETMNFDCLPINTVFIDCDGDLCVKVCLPENHDVLRLSGSGMDDGDIITYRFSNMYNPIRVIDVEIHEVESWRD